jgi:hypothetical protein
MPGRKKSPIEAGVERVLTALLTEAESPANQSSEDGVTSDGPTFGDRVKLIETAGRWLSIVHKIAPEEDDPDAGFGALFSKHHRGASRGGAGRAKAANGSADGTDPAN